MSSALETMLPERRIWDEKPTLEGRGPAGDCGGYSGAGLDVGARAYSNILIEAITRPVKTVGNRIRFLVHRMAKEVNDGNSNQGLQGRASG